MIKHVRGVWNTEQVKTYFDLEGKMTEEWKLLDEFALDYRDGEGGEFLDGLSYRTYDDERDEVEELM